LEKFYGGAINYLESERLSPRTWRVADNLAGGKEGGSFVQDLLTWKEGRGRVGLRFGVLKIRTNHLFRKGKGGGEGNLVRISSI